VRTDPFQNIVDWSGTPPTKPPPTLTWQVGQGGFFINNGGIYSYTVTMDKDGIGYYIQANTTPGPTRYYGTWSGTPTFTGGLSSPPAGVSWTHWTNVAIGGPGIVKANIESNLATIGQLVTFDMTGAVFSVSSSTRKFSIESSTGASAFGASFGMTDMLKEQ